MEIVQKKNSKNMEIYFPSHVPVLVCCVKAKGYVKLQWWKKILQIFRVLSVCNIYDGDLSCWASGEASGYRYPDSSFHSEWQPVIDKLLSATVTGNYYSRELFCREMLSLL